MKNPKYDSLNVIHVLQALRLESCYESCFEPLIWVQIYVINAGKNRIICVLCIVHTISFLCDLCCSLCGVESFLASSV